MCLSVSPSCHPSGGGRRASPGHSSGRLHSSGLLLQTDAQRGQPHGGPLPEFWTRHLSQHARVRRRQRYAHTAASPRATTPRAGEVSARLSSLLVAVKAEAGRSADSSRSGLAAGERTPTRPKTGDRITLGSHGNSAFQPITASCKIVPQCQAPSPAESPGKSFQPITMSCKIVSGGGSERWPGAFCWRVNDFWNTRLFFPPPLSQALPSPPRATPRCPARPPPPPPPTANQAPRRSSTTLTSLWTSRAAWLPRPPPPQVRLLRPPSERCFDGTWTCRDQGSHAGFKNSCEAFAAHLMKNNLCCFPFGGFVLFYLVVHRFSGFCIQM